MSKALQFETIELEANKGREDDAKKIAALFEKDTWLGMYYEQPTTVSIKESPKGFEIRYDVPSKDPRVKAYGNSILQGYFKAAESITGIPVGIRSSSDNPQSPNNYVLTLERIMDAAEGSNSYVLTFRNFEDAIQIHNALVRFNHQEQPIASEKSHVPIGSRKPLTPITFKTPPIEFDDNSQDKSGGRRVG